VTLKIPANGQTATAYKPPVVAQSRTEQKNEEAQKLADQLSGARAKSPNKGLEDVIAEAIKKDEADEVRDALGLDIPFDVNALLTKGIFEQKGMQLGENFYVDMHTLGGEEDILVEMLLDEIYGPLKLGPIRETMKVRCTLAMAITRVNNEPYPVPPVDRADRITEEFRSSWTKKKELANFFKKMQPESVKMIESVYDNLDKMGFLIPGDSKKKSG
jgi:hypothetical protein